MRSKPAFAATAAARTRGLTLVEILVAAAISGLVIMAVLSVLLQTLKAYSYENGQLNVNLDIRKFTNELTTSTRPASYFRVFDSSAALSMGIANGAVDSGVSGDCLLLVYKDPVDDSLFSKVVVYYRQPNASNEGAVRRAVANYSSGTDGPVEVLFPRINPASDPVVISLARGLGAGGKLFTNFNDHSVVVNGEIIRAPTGQFRRASHTFSFSVTPRS